MPGSFEYALDYLIYNEINLSHFAMRYKNDSTGAPAYSPAVMRKIIFLAYSRGKIASRANTEVRKVSFLVKAQKLPITVIEIIKRAIDYVLGRKLYSQRIGLVEPKFQFVLAITFPYD